MGRRICMFVALLSVPLAFVSGCSKPPEDKPYKIGVSLISSRDPSYQMLQRVLEEEAFPYDKELQLLFIPGEGEITNQENQVQKLIDAKGVGKALILQAVDEKEAKRIVEKCRKAGIPVIAYWSKVEGADCVIVPDFRSAGRIAGEELAKLIKGKGKVLEIIGDPDHWITKEISAGFREAISSYSKISVVQVVTYGDKAQTLKIVGDTIGVHPDVRAIFGHDDGITLATTTALEIAVKSGGVVKVGIGTSDSMLGSVSSGRIDATVNLYKKATMRTAFKEAWKACKGEKPTPFLLTEAKLVLKEDIPQDLRKMER